MDKKMRIFTMIVCVFVTAALLALGIYFVVVGGDKLVTGAMAIAVAPWCTALYGVMIYFQINQAKLQKRAEEKMKKRAEKNQAKSLAKGSMSAEKSALSAEECAENTKFKNSANMSFEKPAGKNAQGGMSAEKPAGKNAQGGMSAEKAEGKTSVNAENINDDT